VGVRGPKSLGNPGLDDIQHFAPYCGLPFYFSKFYRFFHAGYYFVEQVLKILSMGKTYFVKWHCLYDGVISFALITLEIVQLIQYGNRLVALLIFHSCVVY